MDNTPDRPSGDDRDDDAGQNPFKGTPFEQMFGALGGAGGPMPDLSALLGQMQHLMTPYDGAVNWTLAKDIARRSAAEKPDPTPSRTDRDRVADSVRLADHWLDTVTPLASGVTVGAAWSRAEWIEQTMDVWKVLVEPVAAHVTNAMNGAIGGSMPAEAQAMAGPLIGMLGKIGGTVFGSQVGQALGGLAGEVLTASDIGLPLGPAGQAALVTTNVTAFADGLDVSEDDVVLYLALRECAHQRLFAQVPWLRQHLIAAVEDYGRGMSIDTSNIEEKLQGFDATNPMAIQEALQGGMFEPEDTPQQKAALERLETTLALVEGWVDEVVGQAATGCPTTPSSRRQYAAAAPQVVPRSRRLPRWSASSSGRGGCATPPRCGARSAPGRVLTRATRCGRTPTCSPRRPTSTTRSASASTSRSRSR